MGFVFANTAFVKFFSLLLFDFSLSQSASHLTYFAILTSSECRLICQTKTIHLAQSKVLK